MNGQADQQPKPSASARQSADELLPRVYEELRRLAFGKLARERPGQTLQPTALVHEAWLRLSKSCDQHWEGRTHFFGASAGQLGPRRGLFWLRGIDQPPPP